MKVNHLIILLTIPFSIATAHEFPILGHTFPISEEPFTKMLMRKLSAIDIAKHQEIIRQQTIEKINNPNPVEGLAKVQKTSSFFFEPVYLLKEDIVMPDGAILYKAGTTINPLHYMDFDRRLIFVDGRDMKQVQWLQRYLKSDGQERQFLENRIILTGGKILDLEKELNTSLYFDQRGVLVNYFGIKALPSIVIQDDDLLKIIELAI